MVIDPSNGRSGCGLTIFASTWAKTLVAIIKGNKKKFRLVEVDKPTWFFQAHIQPIRVLDQMSTLEFAFPVVIVHRALKTLSRH